MLCFRPFVFSLSVKSSVDIHDFRPGSQKIRECTCTAGRYAHAESMFIVVLLFPACQKACDHGIACADGVDELAFGSGKGVDIAVLIQKDCTHAGHGDQNIGGTHFLELFRIGYNGFPCLELHTEDLADFMMIGLDQEGVILQDIEKEILCRVDDKTDSPALERL